MGGGAVTTTPGTVTPTPMDQSPACVTGAREAAAAPSAIAAVRGVTLLMVDTLISSACAQFSATALNYD